MPRSYKPGGERFCRFHVVLLYGFRIYRENMNITDLPEGPYTIACYNRRNRIVLNGSCAHASAAAVQARVPAGTELTLVTHDDGSREITYTREPAKPEKVTSGESQGYHYFSNKAQAHAASRENGKPYSEIDEIEVKTISVVDVLLLIVVAPWIAIMAVPVLPVITLLSVINLCRHLSVRAVWQHVDQPAKREAHAVGLILPVPAHPVRWDLPSLSGSSPFTCPARRVSMSRRSPSLLPSELSANQLTPYSLSSVTMPLATSIRRERARERARS